ncbi:hypothetical protein V6Z11_A11G293900 [Gossypium hirsutum]
MNWDKMWRKDERYHLFPTYQTVTHPPPNPSNFSFVSFHVLSPLSNHPSFKPSFFFEISLVKVKKKTSEQLYFMRKLP